MKDQTRLLAAIGAGFGLLYPLLWLLELPHWAMIAAKGGGVGFLALAAARSARSLDGWLLAAVLGLGATGDVLLKVDFALGAASFALGHVTAIWLYLSNRRPELSAAGLMAAALLWALAVVGPWFLLEGQPERPAFAAYGLVLGAMAATAWLSRFPRKLVAAGAALFVASDLLIAARLGMAERSVAMGLTIWYLYFAGQLLIYLGVSGALAMGRARFARDPSPNFD
ncbi:MAG TPA: lysoplasmalogenase [Allosphingosinicella sp.]|nr:lysoplasmalogenase [Allosphingosinicella sp.]